MLWTIVLFLIVFTIIALVHEGGHFLAAKRAGMAIPECGIGFGPRLFSFKRKDTVYALNLVPILAYVNIAGMEEMSGVSNIPENQLYFSKPPLARFLMAFAGPFMNIVLSFVVLTLVFAFFGVPKSLSAYVDQVQPNSIAARAGLKSGDQLLAINGMKIEKIETAIALIHKSDGRPVTLKIRRNNAIFSITATPKYNPSLKVSVIGFTPLPTYEKVNFFSALAYGFQQTFAMVTLMFAIIWQLVVGAVSVKDLAGPVGIAQITGRYADSGVLSFLSFFAFLNVNIGVLNLLPLPALDGGHIVFALIELITKKRVNEGVQKKIHQWGLFALLALMAYVTLNDVIRIFRPR